MLNYLKKFAMEILPSVAATIIGAYIVNHYIATKPGGDTPVAAAASTAAPKAAHVKPDVVANLPTPGVKAKGISEKAMMEKTASERPTVVEKAQEKPEAKSDATADVKPAEAPAETASIPARHAPAPRDKVRVILPSPVQAVTPPVAPAVAASPVPAPPVEAAASPPDERRDANDLARAAIERLRGGDNAPRQQEAARASEPSRGAETARTETPRVATAPALRPLPPPITVSTPAAEPLDQGSQTRPPYAANASSDPFRPTPPADIPVTRPLDLRAEVMQPSAREHTSVAEDVLSAAKSMFHAVLPK